MLQQCATCNFVYLRNPPGYEALAVEHAWEREHEDRDVRMRKEYPVSRAISKAWRKFYRLVIKKPNKLAARINDWFPAGPVVDIGCGSGDYLASLPDRYQPCGIEISEELARQSRERLAGRSGEIHNKSAIDGMADIADSSLSGIIMRSFLEHEQQPAELLAHAARTLRPGGATIIKVPNYASVNRHIMGKRWCGFRFPGHVNYFTPDSLREMVEATGLRVVRFGFFDRFFLSDNMWLVAQRAPNNA